MRVRIPILRESGGSTLRGELGARGLPVVCVSGPFIDRGAKGEEEYLGVGWGIGEVSMIGKREIERAP
jgi:hypothetical protein